ncbi:MAG: PaaI family thioesterase [Bacteroidota bacterium]|jgi:uncharacterized protein (TIGR00369 family)
MNPTLELLQAEFEQLHWKFPSAQLPPNCSVLMKGEYVDYESRVKLKIAFPVLKEYLNPMNSMQGGFIAAAFDNVFGPLSYLAAHQPCITVSLQTNYIRAVSFGDTLVVTAHVVSRGQSAMHLSAEAVNGKGKIVATCTSQMVPLKVP